MIDFDVYVGKAGLKPYLNALEHLVCHSSNNITLAFYKTRNRRIKNKTEPEVSRKRQ